EYTESNKTVISNGIHIFLDNDLGELSFMNNIDQITIISTASAEKELIPLSKLKDFLTWRQKEFIEKYENTRFDTQSSTYTLFKTALDYGTKALSTINT